MMNSSYQTTRFQVYEVFNGNKDSEFLVSAMGILTPEVGHNHANVSV